jgi:hypothetical protein
VVTASLGTAPRQLRAERRSLRKGTAKATATPGELRNGSAEACGVYVDHYCGVWDFFCRAEIQCGLEGFAERCAIGRFQDELEAVFLAEAG